ncbi:MAG: hypothetical protein JWP97_4983 [Labilithrix sp.]|nr:hypothetical protein [Labilithrix sp.]
MGLLSSRTFVSAFGVLSLIASACSSDPEAGAGPSTSITSTNDAVDGGAATAAPDAAAPTASWCSTPVGGKVSLPTDDAVHAKEPTEWWYWTGHVKTAEGRWFGFEEVFFRAQVLGVPGYMVHSAVTDIDGNTFHHFSTLGPGDLAPTPNGFDFAKAGHSVKGGGGHDALVAAGDGFGLSLDVSTANRATLQNATGYTDYSFGGYTYYYSRERMDAKGTITVGGDVFPVTGTAWFDHQYGDIQTAVSRGWDWFALQLNDGREMMLFVVRDHGKQVLVGASVTDRDCNATEVPSGQVSLASAGTWHSPHTACTYPAGWTVKVGSETFVISPYVADQEVYTSTPIYWEGASKVTREDGTLLGRAYVELSGYCPQLP